jgi:hypothetical protein
MIPNCRIPSDTPENSTKTRKKQMAPTLACENDGSETKKILWIQVAGCAERSGENTGDELLYN